MKIKIIFLFISIFIFSCSNNQEDIKLNNFFNREFESMLVDYPESGTYMGRYENNDKLTDMSLGAIKSRHNNTINSLEEIKNIKRSLLSESSKINYDLYMRKLRQSIRGFEYMAYLMPIDQLGGIQISAANLVGVTPFNNLEDYNNYLSRLEALPRRIRETMILMSKGIDEDIVPPKVVLKSVPEQIKTQFTSSVEDSPFYDPFTNPPESISSEVTQKAKDAKQIILGKIMPAFIELHSFFINKYLPSARDNISVKSLPNGEKYYKHLISYYTTTNLSADEIYKIGKSEVDRIKEKMQATIKETGFKGSFQDFLDFIRSDRRFYYEEEEELLDGYRAICKKIDPKLSALFGRLPRIPYGVKPIPSYQAQSSPTAYYHGASDDGSRPGYFWANTYNLGTRPKYEMIALALHEAVPGHHLQISLAQEMKNVPEFRKRGGYTAFVEGWALYAESLGEEMGLYEDPYDKFGQLTYEMWRACRLVVDTGMHAFGWSRQEAVEYMLQNTGKTSYDINVEVDRYITWPGQALAYKIGELKIKELRQRSEDALGENFNIREFHDLVLENGAIPLDLLEELINHYIQSYEK